MIQAVSSALEQANGAGMYGLTVSRRHIPKRDSRTCLAWSYTLYGEAWGRGVWIVCT